MEQNVIEQPSFVFQQLKNSDRLLRQAMRLFQDCPDLVNDNMHTGFWKEDVEELLNKIEKHLWTKENNAL